MIKIIDPKSEYRSQIISLWQKCFGDNEEYICFFLDNCPGSECIGYLVEDKVVSMLFLLDGELNSDKCKYLYAACTDEYFRKQGIMEELINFTKFYCIDNNISSIFLVPATEKLYSYYAKFGFVPSFRKQILKLKANNTNYNNLNNFSDIDEICRIKCNLLKNINSFSFSGDVLKYTVKEHFFNGGSVAVYASNNEIALFFYYLENCNIIVKEMLTNHTISDELIIKLFSNNDIENIYIYTPIVYNNRDIGEKYTKCGMCLPLNEKSAGFLAQNTSLYAGMYLD